MPLKGFECHRSIGTVEPSNGRYPNAFSSLDTVRRELGYRVFKIKNQHVDDLHNGKEEVFVYDLSGLPGTEVKIALAPLSIWTKIKNFFTDWFG
jgi:hypothetical protein